MKPPPPCSPVSGNFPPHGLMLRLVFAVYPVNIEAAALQVSGKVELVSDVVLKHIKMRQTNLLKQSAACWATADLFLCVSLSYCYPPAAVALPPALSLAVL